jgi:hypothetical protein
MPARVDWTALAAGVASQIVHDVVGMARDAREAARLLAGLSQTCVAWRVAVRLTPLELCVSDVAKSALWLSQHSITVIG